MSRRTTVGAPAAVEAAEWRHRKHVGRRTAGGSRFLKAAAAFLPPSFRGRPTGQPLFRRLYIEGDPSAARRRQALFSSDLPPLILAIYIYILNIYSMQFIKNNDCSNQTNIHLAFLFHISKYSNCHLNKMCQITET